MPRKPSNGSAEEFFPDKLTLPSLREAAADCQACDLWERGTQTVFGEGRRGAIVMFVGEQPGNEEDLTGKPFVGPAGRLLDAELKVIKPKVIVALGATAAQALLGPKFRVTKQRGEFIESTLAPYVMATVHPSSILRAPDDETRRLEHRRFVDDLKKLARVLK